MSRRSLLIAGAVVPLAGCDVFDSANEHEPAATPAPPHPDEPIRARAVEAERALMALYLAAAAAHPDLEADLERFANRHLRHIDAIESTVPPLAPGSPTPTPATQAPATTDESPVPPDIAADPDALVEQLRDAEIAAVEERTADCLEARDHRLATVLASIAACEAAHDRLLRSLR
ncbi:MAG TPA: hypothetical protein VFR13_10215 [Jiangellaceae bacterium]|nr:hypothetical protein [Jiangellaceae bacterium]